VGTFVYNNSLGRGAEFYNRVDSNDPANSALILVVLATAGIEADAVLKDKLTLADVLSGTTNEVTNSGYARKVLTDADLVAFAPDLVNDRVDLDIPDQTYLAVGAGDGWSHIVVCYDPDTTAGTDATIIPLTQHAFPLTPDGSDISVQVPNGFFRAV